MVERKNHHLVETARTLLLDHIVPQHFWGDTILTAYYLINLMPSSVLGDQVPHSLLFPNQPLSCLPPRVLECTCFVHILTPGQDKLSAKAMKCIFLGYSRLQSSYHCYSLDSHRYFVSADVTFFEHSSTFSTPPSSNPEDLSLPLIFPIPALSSESPATPSRPLQFYTRHPHTNTRPPDDLSPTAPSSTTSILSSPTDPLIIIRKGTLIRLVILILLILSSRIIIYLHHILFLFPLCFLFLFLTLFMKGLSHPRRKQAMVEEMVALHSTSTWNLVPLPASKSPVHCRWV